LTHDAKLHQKQTRLEGRVGKSNTCGSAVDPQVQAKRFELLQICCRCNISIDAIIDDTNHVESLICGGFTVGGQRALLDMVGDLRDEHLNTIKEILRECFPQFGLICDASPFFTDALVLKVRTVHAKTFEIIELVIAVKLYPETLDGDKLGYNAILGILKEFELEGTEWRVYMMDCASMSYSAIKRVVNLLQATSLTAPCASHGMNNAGKQFEYPSGKEVLGYLTTMVKHQLCKAKIVFKRKFEMSPKQGGSPRWYGFYEHADQTDEIGLDDIKEYIKERSGKKYSEKASKALHQKLEDPEYFAMSQVELAAVTNGGRSLVKCCYKSETDRPLILRAHDILKDVEHSYHQ
jgi:hypothetical protein